MVSSKALAKGLHCSSTTKISSVAWQARNTRIEIFNGLTQLPPVGWRILRNMTAKEALADVMDRLQGTEATMPLYSRIIGSSDAVTSTERLPKP